MKKIIALLLAMLLVLPMVACNKNKGQSEENENGGGTGDSGDSGTEGEGNVELPGVDFINDDLSDYIEIDSKYYKNFTVKVDPNRVSELEIENTIIQTICTYKNPKSVEGDGVISVGDVVSIYYQGYYLKDGEPYFFDGGDNTKNPDPNNLIKPDPYKLEIGSGNFISGFEYNLIGKVPAEHSEDNPIVVETFFPENYHSAELAGKTAYFIVTVVEMKEYNAPELNDEFISGTLKLTMEDLKAYQGETLTEKYRSYVKESILSEKGIDLETLVMEAFWLSVVDVAVVKKYPEKQVQEVYDSMLEELDYYFNYYSKYYDIGDDYDGFMCNYLDLARGSDWKAYVKDMAKSQVKEQLIFYHIMNVEGFKPTDEEYAALFDEYLANALRKSNIIPENYETEAEYLSVKENYKNMILERYGEEYFMSMFCYQQTVNGIKGFANIVETAE